MLKNLGLSYLSDLIEFVKRPLVVEVLKADAVVVILLKVSVAFSWNSGNCALGMLGANKEFSTLSCHNSSPENAVIVLLSYRPAIAFDPAE